MQTPSSRLLYQKKLIKNNNPSIMLINSKAERIVELENEIYYDQSENYCG